MVQHTISGAWSLPGEGWRVDVLRGMAILAVVVVHSSLGRSDSFLSDYFLFGMYGVELFFFISGFLMSYKYTSSDHQGFQKRFWIRRFGRIFPLWALFGLAGFLGWLWGLDWVLAARSYEDLETLWVVEGKPLDNPIIAFFLTLFFLGWLSPNIWNLTIPGGWSIQAEFMHYTIFAIFREKSIFIWAFLLLVIGLIYLGLELSGAGLGNGVLDSLWRIKLFSTLLFFVAGIVLQQFLGSGKNFGNLNMGTAVALGACVFLSSYIALPFGEVSQATIFILSCVLIASGMKRNSKISRTFCLLGKYSYFLYFFHFYMLYFYDNYVLPLLGGLAQTMISNHHVEYLLSVSSSIAFVLVFGIPIASVSWKVFEKPLINFSRRMTGV